MSDKALTGAIGDNFKKVMEESESCPEVDEDWLIAKANAVLYALRRRFRSRITATDTAMMRDLLADVVMAAGIRIKKEG